MARKDPRLTETDVRSLEQMIAWVRRSRNQDELIERAKGMKAFVELHPRLHDAALEYRPAKDRND